MCKSGITYESECEFLKAKAKKKKKKLELL